MKLNILIIVVTVSILYLVWGFGLEKLYAHLLQGGVNLCYIFKGDIFAETKEMGEKIFFFLYYDNSGWKEPLETIVLPLIVLIGWQIFVLFHVPLKPGLKVAGRNFLIFYTIQVLFLLLLYGLKSSELAMFLFRLLKNSFGIIVLFMIIWDIYDLDISFKNKPSFNKKPKYE